ncbi:hypothetical protein HDU76_002871, partial [Blyttiomyces sp. JEL0837]
MSILSASSVIMFAYTREWCQRRIFILEYTLSQLWKIPINRMSVLTMFELRRQSQLLSQSKSSASLDKQSTALSRYKSILSTCGFDSMKSLDMYKSNVDWDKVDKVGSETHGDIRDNDVGKGKAVAGSVSSPLSRPPTTTIVDNVSKISTGQQNDDKSSFTPSNGAGSIPGLGKLRKSTMKKRPKRAASVRSTIKSDRATESVSFSLSEFSSDNRDEGSSSIIKGSVGTPDHPSQFSISPSSQQTPSYMRKLNHTPIISNGAKGAVERLPRSNTQRASGSTESSQIHFETSKSTSELYKEMNLNSAYPLDSIPLATTNQGIIGVTESDSNNKSEDGVTRKRSILVSRKPGEPAGTGTDRRRSSVQFNSPTTTSIAVGKDRRRSSVQFNSPTANEVPYSRRSSGQFASVVGIPNRRGSSIQFATLPAIPGAEIPVSSSRKSSLAPFTLLKLPPGSFLEESQLISQDLDVSFESGIHEGKSHEKTDGENGSTKVQEKSVHNEAPQNTHQDSTALQRTISQSKLQPTPSVPTLRPTISISTLQPTLSNPTLRPTISISTLQPSSSNPTLQPISSDPILQTIFTNENLEPTKSISTLQQSPSFLTLHPTISFSTFNPQRVSSNSTIPQPSGTNSSSIRQSVTKTVLSSNSQPPSWIQEKLIKPTDRDDYDSMKTYQDWIPIRTKTRRKSIATLLAYEK